MMRSQFDLELQKLRTLLNETSFLAENLLTQATKSLQEEIDDDVEDRVKEMKKELYAKKAKGERACIRMLLRQQPVARDLQFISSSMKVLNNLERIGEQASEIFMLIDRPIEDFVLQSLRIDEMAMHSIRMVHNAMTAFLNVDLGLGKKMAEQVVAQDDLVDAAFKESKEQLVEIIKDGSVNQLPDIINDMMIAKYYEKIGDHAVAIARTLL